MTGLAEVLGGYHYVPHGFDATGAPYGEHVDLSPKAASHLDVVARAWFAEWLTSDDTVEVVAEAQGDAYWSKGSPKSWEGYARVALAALAELATGDTDD